VAAACTLLGIMLSDLVAKPDRKDVPQQAEIKRKEIFKNIALETEGEVRRIRVNAEVCLRQGMLEQLLTRKRTKEHEAILAADIDAKHLHTALLLTGAEPGKTVQFRPKLVAPTGTRVKIFLEYKTKDGKEVRTKPKATKFYDFLVLVNTPASGWQLMAISFKSTQLKKATTLNTILLGVKMPSFALLFKASPVAEKRGTNTFFGWRIDQAGYVTEDVYIEASKIYDSLVGKKVEVTVENDEPTKSDDAF